MAASYKPNIVIIGSGISGLSAANRLISHGFHHVVILEAKSDIGGRILTLKHDDGVIELGAQWIHGEDDNAVFELAKSHNLVGIQQMNKLNHFVCRPPPHLNTESDDENDDFRIDYFYTSNGHKIPVNIAEETCYILDKIFDSGDVYFNDKSQSSPFKSIAEYAENEFHVTYLQQVNNSADIKEMQKAILNWRMIIERADNACQSLFDIPTEMWGAYTVCPGEYHVSLQNGFKDVVNILTKNIPKTKLETNTEVISIFWDETYIEDKNKIFEETAGNQYFDQSTFIRTEDNKTSRVVVETKSGKLLKADYVIFTCSLGALKKQANSMFFPSLPIQKLDSILKLGFGTVDKIYLEFETVFWEDDCAGIQLAWIPGNDVYIDCKEHGTKTEWWKAISGFDTVEFHPKLLCGWISGEEAKIMEQLSDEDVLLTCHKLLQTFCNKEIPKPVKLIRSKWGSDPFIQGSYSFFTHGTSLNDIDVLGEPLPNSQDPKVLFAGEATHKKYFSTTHGAMSSGIREAERIIENERQRTELKN